MFESIILPIKPQLAASGVVRLGVFGSFARDEATPDSDVDILVAFQPEQRTFDDLFKVGEALEGVFHRRVDLVTEDSLSPHLGPRILKEVKYVDLGH